MKKNVILAIVFLASVIVFSLVWNLSDTTWSMIGAIIMLSSAIGFVVIVNHLFDCIKL